MGYYDFDEHFWSPQEVCAQAPKQETPEPLLNVPKLIRNFFRKMFERSAQLEQS